MATGLCRLFGKEALHLGSGKTLLRVSKRKYGPPPNRGLELFPRRLVLQDHGYVPTLSPSQVTSLLQINETALEAQIEGQHEIKGYESNQLASNYPIEDRRAQAKLQHSNGALFAVYDGHAGCACAQAVSERLFEYIAVSLLPYDKLEELNHALKTDSPMDLLHYHYNRNDYRTDDLSSLFRNSLQRYVVESLSLSGLDDRLSWVADGLSSAFTRLDTDVSTEALPVGGAINMESLEVAMSGSCATVAHIDDIHLTLASIGDTRAVLGRLTEEGEWEALPLTNDHNFDNKNEVERIRSAHPLSESSFVLKNNRLLGQLIPLRAFGDVRCKWSIGDLRNVVNILDNTYFQNMVPMNYYSPPYLIAEPEVTYHRLTPYDKFLVLATDGLWEMLTSDVVVKLVGEHLEGKQTVDHFELPDTGVKLGKLNQTLQHRKAGLAQKSTDTNVATHLIRNALGPEHRKVSEMLTLPQEVVRYYRDDITVTVVYFCSDYVGQRTINV